MNQNKTTSREPLFHVVKRPERSGRQMLLFRLGAVALSILAGGLFILAIGYNPIEIYGTILNGAFRSKIAVQSTIKITIPLCISALGATLAFKMKFWNIGGEGQILVGCLAAAACMICLADTVSNGLLIAISAVASIAAGAIWGGIPAFFKAKWNTNETLFTLMMNYVATQLVAFFVIIWEVPKGAGQIGIINQSTQIGWLPQVGGNKYMLNVLVILALTVLVYIYLNYSKHGYELTVVGESERTARYVGIKVEKVIIRTMLLSGAICGLVGFLLVSGTDHTLSTSLSGGRGFTAVMISWLAKFNPIIMIFASMLLAFLDKGASAISTNFGLNHSFSDILTGLILFFIIGCEFFISYKISFRKAAGKESAENV